MGRPVNKRFFGDPELGGNLTVEVNTGNGPNDSGYIISQKGSGKFRVTDGTTVRNCFLVNKATSNLSVGEMVIVGGGDSSRVPIAKLFNRTAIDYSGNRYTWEVDNDSTQTQLTLNAI